MLILVYQWAHKTLLALLETCSK